MDGGKGPEFLLFSRMLQTGQHVWELAHILGSGPPDQNAASAPDMEVISCQNREWVENLEFSNEARIKRWHRL